MVLVCLGGWQWQISERIPHFVPSCPVTGGSPRIIPYEKFPYEKQNTDRYWKSILIHISEANITPPTVYLVRKWVNASLRAKHCASSSHSGPKDRESLSHQSQRKWLGQIPPALLQAASGRTLQKQCYLRKAEPRNLSHWRSITHKCNIRRRSRWGWNLQTSASMQEILPGRRQTWTNYHGCSPRQGWCH